MEVAVYVDGLLYSIELGWPRARQLGKELVFTRGVVVTLIEVVDGTRVRNRIF